MQQRYAQPTPPPGATPRSAPAPGAVNNGAPGVAQNVRNVGGGRGLEVIPTTSRALKQLTGQ